MSLTLGLAAFFSAARGASRRTALRAKQRDFGPTTDSAISRAFRHGPTSDPQVLRDAAGELARCGCDGITVLVMQVADIVELELVFGREAAEEAIDQALGRLTRVARGRGTALRTASDTFALLMPDVEPHTLVHAVEAALGPTRCIEFELDGDEIVVVPELVARALEPGECAASAHDVLCRDLARARSTEQRRREYLRLERESHTRPASLAAQRR
jgi:hypothetical protein